MPLPFHLPAHFKSLAPYHTGKPVEALQREKGLKDIVKLASNENPLGPNPRAVAAIAQALGDIHRYPDGAAHALTHALARKWNCQPDQVVIGNGSDDLIHLLTRLLLQPGDNALIPAPSFAMYHLMVQATGADGRLVPLKDFTLDLEAMAAAIDPKTRLIFICNPNNPTGTAITRAVLAAFLEKVPEQVVVVLDEAYMEFVRDPHCARGMELDAPDKTIVVLRTFSKAYGLAGLRIGYGIMPAALAGYLHRLRQPFNVNRPAQIGAAAALNDTAFLDKTVQLAHTELDRLYADLRRQKIGFIKSQANFFLVDVAPHTGVVVYRQLLEKGVIVRAMDDYGYPHHIRLSVGTPHENTRFLDAFLDIQKTLEQP